MAPRDVCGGRQWRHRPAPDRPGGRRGPPRRVVYGGGGSRYAASYMAGGESVVTVSELGGVQHLETIELATGMMHPLAATTGGAVAPEASFADSHVFFLS